MTEAIRTMAFYGDEGSLTGHLELYAARRKCYYKDGESYEPKHANLAFNDINYMI